MKKLTMIIILTLLLGFSGNGFSDEIKLPINTCPVESGFVMDKRGFFWHFYEGMASDYYNNMTVDQVQKLIDKNLELAWNDGACPPMAGIINGKGMSARIPAGTFDDPHSWLNYEEMKEKFPTIFEDWKSNSGT